MKSPRAPGLGSTGCLIQPRAWISFRSIRVTRANILYTADCCLVRFVCLQTDRIGIQKFFCFLYVVRNFVGRRPQPMCCQSTTFAASRSTRRNSISFRVFIHPRAQNAVLIPTYRVIFFIRQRHRMLFIRRETERCFLLIT